MKKYLTVAAVLLVAACGKKEEAAPAADTPAPAADAAAPAADTTMPRDTTGMQ
jgi:hypothetical protein